MQKFNNINEICDALNSYAKDKGFFSQEPAAIDEQANGLVAEFSKSHGLDAHTASQSRWWFASPEAGMYEDGEIELYPMIKHAVEKLHPGDKDKEIKFVAVNVAKAKITENPDDE